MLNCIFFAAMSLCIVVGGVATHSVSASEGSSTEPESSASSHNRQASEGSTTETESSIRVHIRQLSGVRLRKVSEAGSCSLESRPHRHRRQLSRLMKTCHRRIDSLVTAGVRSGHKRTPSQIKNAFKILREDSEKQLHDLQESGYHPSQDEKNRALLHVTPFQQSDMIVKLLNIGADPNAKDVHGRTPAMLACMYGNYAGLLVLIGHAADLTQRDEHGKDARIYTFPGQTKLEPEEWSMLRLHETDDIPDPKQKCREILDMHIKKRRKTISRSEVIAGHARCTASCIVL